MNPGAVRLHYHGHACLDVEWQGVRVLIDPFRAGDFRGAVDLPPLPVEPWTHVIFTHDHADHAYQGRNGDAVVGERAESSLGVRRVDLYHDVHAGRLRGGLAGTLILPTPAGPVVHLGDVGEPAAIEHVALFPARIRILVVPCGGFFTIGASEAIEWVQTLQPDVALLCHGSDTGVRLAELTSTEEVVSRLPVSALPALLREPSLTVAAPAQPLPARGTCWWFPRPTGYCTVAPDRTHFDLRVCGSQPGVNDTACCGI